jgi:putative acetyltransferase
MQAMLDVTDNWLNLTRTELSVYTDNAAAVALYERFGCKTEGTHRRYASETASTWTLIRWLVSSD